MPDQAQDKNKRPEGNKNHHRNLRRKIAARAPASFYCVGPSNAAYLAVAERIGIRQFSGIVANSKVKHPSRQTGAWGGKRLYSRMLHERLRKTSVLTNLLQRDPSRTFCTSREEDSRSGNPKSIVPFKVRTGSGRESDDACRELHSVKASKSSETAKPPGSEREYSTCLSRPLKSVRMISPSLSISRKCCVSTFLEASGNFLRSWLSRMDPPCRPERIPIFHFP
jgi:hypothetical protein